MVKQKTVDKIKVLGTSGWKKVTKSIANFYIIMSNVSLFMKQCQ